MTSDDVNRGGRPPINGKPMTRVTIYLCPDQRLWALREGKGNISDGIRQLLDELQDAREWTHAETVKRATPPAVLPRSRHQ